MRLDGRLTSRGITGLLLLLLLPLTSGSSSQAAARTASATTRVHTALTGTAYQDFGFGSASCRSAVIATYSFNNKVATVRRFNGATWTVTTARAPYGLDHTGDFSYGFSLNHPHAALARWNGQEYRTEQVETPVGVDPDRSISVENVTGDVAVGTVQVRPGDPARAGVRWRWDGSTWRVRDYPVPLLDIGAPLDVKTYTLSNTWRIVNYSTNCDSRGYGCVPRPSMYRANGSGGWVKVPLPYTIGSLRELNGSFVLHARPDPKTGYEIVTVLRWDGAAWRSVTRVPAGFATWSGSLATGGCHQAKCSRPLAWRFDGVRFTSVPTYNPGVQSTLGSGMAGTFAWGWAKGPDGTLKMLVQRWNGRAFTRA